MTEARVGPKSAQWIIDHTERYLASNGADGHFMTFPNDRTKQIPTLLLTTVGRRSGEKFLFPLIYGRHGNGYVLIASKGGAPAHPGWYLNLRANPRVEIQVGSQRLVAMARTASGAERAQLWSQMAELFTPFAEYQKKAAPREIPVVVLDPVAA